eukprot:COSAG02_NODE_6082_length_3815_cov_1.717707_3_plen_199_part_00
MDTMDGVVDGLRNGMLEEPREAMAQDWLQAQHDAAAMERNGHPLGGRNASNAWCRPYASAAAANRWPAEIREAASWTSSYPQWSGQQPGKMRLADLRKSPMTMSWRLCGDAPSEASSGNTATFNEGTVSVQVATSLDNHARPTSDSHTEAVKATSSAWDHGTTEPPNASCCELGRTKYYMPGPRKLIGRSRGQRLKQS